MAISDFLRSFTSLGSQTNKDRGAFKDEKEEGVIETPVSVLTLDKDDNELLELKNAWQKKWEDSEARKDLESRQKENEKYWKGEHYSNAQKQTSKRDQVNNLIFEAIETFLPVVSRQLAEPTITTSPNPVAQLFKKKVEDKIVAIADEMRLRLKVKKAIRHWSLYFLGAVKLGWSIERDEIAVEAVRPQQLILDPDAITDECEYDGYYLGHYRTDTAEDLIARFGKAEEIKKVLGKDNLGTKLRYIEWWTTDYVFWTLGDKVLGKARNPHWNYDEDQEIELGVNELGEPIMGTQTIEGKNHFRVRKIPFAFLSVFNLGKSPFDDTNLLEQVLPLQDIVNKRVRQIDKNADNTNGGTVVSGDHFTKEQAAQVGRARRRGETIWVPRGDVNRAFAQVQGPPLPNFVYQDLIDTRDQMRGVFGITGLSAQGIKSEDTVRGKILVRGQDADRASLIVDQVEQFYDYIFNWFVQLMMVYYDEPRPVTSSAGEEVISSQEFIWPLVVSVKEGSLIPKDRLTMRNEAIELWSAGALDPLTLAERLEMSNPQEYVQRLITWKTNPLELVGGQVPTAPVSQEEVPQEENQEILSEIPIQ